MDVLSWGSPSCAVGTSCKDPTKPLAPVTCGPSPGFSRCWEMQSVLSQPAEPAVSGGSGSWLWRSGAAAPSAGTAPLSGVRVPHQALARKLNYLVSLDSFRVVRFDLLSDFVVYVSLACVFNFSFV